MGAAVSPAVDLEVHPSCNRARDFQATVILLLRSLRSHEEVVALFVTFLKQSLEEAVGPAAMTQMTNLDLVTVCAAHRPRRNVLLQGSAIRYHKTALVLPLRHSGTPAPLAR